MTQLRKELATNCRPVKLKKPCPTQQGLAKVPVPVGLTEERVREIAKEEITKYMGERAVFAMQSEDQGR